LGKHIFAALNDCWTILTQSKKTAKQKNNYSLLHSGVPSAFSQEKCESAVLIFLKYLSEVSENSIYLAHINSNLNIIIPFVLHYLSKKPLGKNASAESSENSLKIKLGQAILLKNEMLLICVKFMKCENIEINEELMNSSLELLEKFADTKIIDFSLKIVQIANYAVDAVLKNEKINYFGKIKILSVCEEILGKMWIQGIDAKNSEENELFGNTFNTWKKILLFYMNKSDTIPQFQLTFNTILTGLSSQIIDTDINNGKIYAKLTITTFKELFAISPPPAHLKTAISQYLLDLVTLMQKNINISEKFDLCFIIALNTAIMLGNLYSEEISKSLFTFLELYDNDQIQQQILKTSLALFKANSADLKTNSFTPLIFEYLLHQLYKTIESPSLHASPGPKLQLILLLFQIIGANSDELFNMIFSLCMSLCSTNFNNNILKEAINAMNVILSMNPGFFKAALTKLDSREIKYLQLLMKLNASNQITA